MKITTDPRVKDVFIKYPKHISPKIKHLRDLIIQSAKELELDEIDETLKWGEPSYLSRHGSTIRIDWKETTPDIYSIYFKCTSRLVETFKEVYGPLFEYESNRAIRFNLNEKVPEHELKDCIKAALIYHKVKEKDQLGIPFN